MNQTRHRRTAKKIEEDDARLMAHLDAGGSPKAFAIDNGIGLQSVYRRANALGYRAAMIRVPRPQFCSKTAA